MEILIKARDAGHYNLIKNERGCYKRGDPVVAMHDGNSWGHEERLPKFWRVAIREVQPSFMRPFCHSHYSGLWTPDSARAFDSGDRVLVRRRWKFMPELLAPSLRMSLLRGDVTELSWDQWMRCLHDKALSSGAVKSKILKVA